MRMKNRNRAIKVLCGLLLTSSGALRAQEAPVDSDTPRIFITSPTPGTLSNSVTEVRGTASDSSSDIAKVEVAVGIGNGSYSSSYWDGVQWTSTPTPLLPDLVLGSGHTVEWRLGNLPPAPPSSTGTGVTGQINIRVFVTDSAGHFNDALTHYIIDRCNPSFPYYDNQWAKQTRRDFSTLEVVADTSGSPGLIGAPIKSVVWTLRSLVDGKYWDGKGWAIQAVPLPMRLRDTVSLTSSRWAPSGMLPPVAALKTGNYQLQAVATDGLENRSTFSSLRATVFIDVTAPRVTIKSPVNGSRVVGLSSLRATVLDDPILKFPGYVQATLKRRQDNAFWDGSNWKSAPAVFYLYLYSGRGSQFESHAVPRGTRLRTGAYIFGVTATDEAGNKTSVASNFVVEASSASPPVLVRAGLVESTIQLRFSAPLDNALASDKVRYTLSSEGRIYDIQATQTNAAGTIVTLSFAKYGEEFVPTQKIEVTWNGLIAANGLVIPAGAITITVPALKP